MFDGKKYKATKAELKTHYHPLSVSNFPNQYQWPLLFGISLPETHRTVLSLISCFAGGVFLAACLLDIIPDYLSDISEQLQDTDVSLLWVRIDRCFHQDLKKHPFPKGMESSVCRSCVTELHNKYTYQWGSLFQFSQEIQSFQII